jgi:beta-1,3-galactosyltransferase 1
MNYQYIKFIIGLNFIFIIIYVSYLSFNNIGIKNHFYKSFDILAKNRIFQTSSEMKLINEYVEKVHQIDDHLKQLSKVIKLKGNSQLIYPNEVLEMTNISINKERCSQQYGKDLLLLALVFNRVDRFERRQTIRQTWGQDLKEDNRSKLYFTVGLSKNENVQKRLLEEDNKYGDIIQFGYYENYYNCTIKALGLLRWTSLNCPFVKYMLKVDDDTVVLKNNLLNFCNSTPADSIHGVLRQNSSVFREKNGWSISEIDYPENYYPDFIGGPYLIPGSLILPLYKTAVTKALPAVPFEDVYLTGIVANKLQIARKNLSSVIYLNGQCHISKVDFCYHKNVSIFWQGLDDLMIRKVWKKYQNRTVCPSRGSRCS